MVAEWKVTTKYALNATDRRETECPGAFTDWMEPALEGKGDPTKRKKKFGSASLSVRGVFISPV
jgi:hypothetical protein